MVNADLHSALRELAAEWEAERRDWLTFGAAAQRIRALLARDVARERPEHEWRKRFEFCRNFAIGFREKDMLGVCFACQSSWAKGTPERHDADCLVACQPVAEARED